MDELNITEGGAEDASAQRPETQGSPSDEAIVAIGELVARVAYILGLNDLALLLARVRFFFNRGDILSDGNPSPVPATRPVERRGLIAPPATWASP